MDGEQYLKCFIEQLITRRESIFTLCSVLCLIPHMTSQDEEDPTSDSIAFQDRVWTLGSIVNDASLKRWIKVLKKRKVEQSVVHIRETNTSCLHQKPKKRWCFYRCL